MPTWFFVSWYLLLWTAFGAVAFLVAAAADLGGERFEPIRAHGARIAAGVLALAGLYQLTPLKRACLTKCRTPLSFILGSWRDGYWGAFQMGLLHGTYCLGCCWLLFVLLFPLGVMSVVAMGLVTVLIFVEKVAPRGHRIGQAVGIGLLAFGLAGLAFPRLLPLGL